jgi:D-alanine-D-alanine ligase
MTDFILPARLSEQEKRRVNELTITLFELFNCHGMARFDYRVCPKRGPLLLELNSIPGLTNTSDLPAQAKEYGLSFDGLIEHILNSAFTRML